MNIKLKQSISLEDLKILKDSVFKFQEVLLFKPDQYKGKLQNTSDFNHEEYYFTVDKDIRLHGVLFKTTTKCKGVIFYLHGNKAIINNLDVSLKFYLDQGYDLFTWDYRGYGKSDSEIKNESEFYADAQKVFSEFYQQSSYEHFIMLGYSLGTGLAIKLAADNSELIDLLILKAPYYSIVEVVRQRFFRFAPKQFIKYPLESYKYINQVKAPIVIFHGKKDTTIYYESSVKLKKLLKEGDQLYLIDDLVHSPFDQDEYFRQKLVSILSENLNQHDND